MKEWKRSKTDTTWERLFTAVCMLATGSDELQKRLYCALIHLLPLHVEEFPKELQAEAKELRGYCDKKSVYSMTDEEASNVASKIVHLYDVVARDYCLPEFLG